MKKNGFTLAEILVTLGIIGIVSAITVPSLMSNFQKKTYETGAKKAYNTVSNAISTYMANEAIDDLTEAPFIGTTVNTYGSRENTTRYDTKTTQLQTFVNKYFKVVSLCDGYEKCFSDSFYSLDHSTSAKWSSFVSGSIAVLAPGQLPGTMSRCTVGAQLADGMSMCFNAVSATKDTIQAFGSIKESTTETKNTENTMFVDVDINGVAGPNVSGRDIFTMSVNSNGVVAFANFTENDRATAISNAKKNATPLNIAVLRSNGWQMDY